MIDKNKTGLNSDQRGTMFQCHKCNCVNTFSIQSCAYCGEEQQEPIDQRITELEKEVAALKVQISTQPSKHPLGDSLNGNYDTNQPRCNANYEKS